MLHPFKNILAVQNAYGDSVEALEWAAKLSPLNGRVKVLDVQPPLSALWQDLFDDELAGTPVDQRRDALQELVRSVEFPTEKVSVRVRRGTPVIQVVKEMHENVSDLVIKEAHAKTSDFVFGSLDMRLLRCCPAPVWLSHSNRKSNQLNRILVALNPEAGPREMMLNQRLLRLASALATGFNCKLFVAAAYQSHVAGFRVIDPESQSRVERQAKQTRQAAREQLDSLLQCSQKAIAEEDVLLDDCEPDDVILSAVAKMKPDLLVMGSVARHGLTGMLLGNAAERVLRGVDCSVLALKPNEFVSPIEPDEDEAGDARSAQFAF